MKNVKKYLVYLVFCLIGLIIFNDNVYAANATKCVYKESSLNKTVTFIVTPNDKGGVTIDSVEFNDGGYQNSNSNVSSVNFIDTTNKIVKCPNYLYTKIEAGANYKSSYTLSFINFEGASRRIFDLDDTVNDGQALIGSDVTKINSCNYTGSINGNKVINITVLAYSNNTFEFESSDNNYTVKLNDGITVDNFRNGCPKLFVNCGSSNTNGFCSLNLDAIRDDYMQEGDTTPDSEEIQDSQVGEYSCTYIGQISGKSLIISKTTDHWKVKLGDGGTKEILSSKVGANIFPSSNCEDIFYLYNKKDSVKMVDSKSSFLEETIAGYCRGYGNEVEQFCHKGKCKINKPLCGAEASSDDDANGNCPSELRPVIYFVKKIGFNALRIFVPIVLVIMGSIDLIKAIMSNDDKAMKDSVSKFVKRALAAILMFFIVTIVSVVINMVVDTGVGKNGWEACWYNID